MKKIQHTSLTYQEFKIFCSKELDIPLHDISDDLIEIIIYIANKKEPKSILIQDSIDFKEFTENLDSEYHNSDWLLELGTKTINIDIKTSTINSISISLDYFFTSGLISSILQEMGLLKQSIFILNETHGEVCHLDSIKHKKVQNFEELKGQIKQKKCLYPHHKCIYVKEGICNINIDNIKENIDSLKEKKVIVEKDGKWLAL